MCRCRQKKQKCCGNTKNRARLDYLQQSTFDRYGIGISLYFKYLKLLLVTYVRACVRGCVRSSIRADWLLDW